MSKKRILLSDNDTDFLKIQEEILINKGFEVITASTSSEARRILDKGSVDIAILDIRLTDDDDDKDITGLLLAKTVAPAVPKIILTRFPTYEAVREALGPSIEGLPAAIEFVRSATSGRARKLASSKRCPRGSSPQPRP